MFKKKDKPEDSFKTLTRKDKKVFEKARKMGPHPLTPEEEVVVKKMLAEYREWGSGVVERIQKQRDELSEVMAGCDAAREAIDQRLAEIAEEKATRAAQEEEKATREEAKDNK